MNAIISNIVNAKPRIFIEDGSTVVRISCNGRRFVGLAEVHQQDMDFQSNIVGTTIALSRAKQDAFKWAIRDTELELKAKREMYWHGTTGMKELYDPELADPFGGFIRSVQSTERKLYNLRQALRSEEQALNNYLKNHKEALSKLKSYRAEKAEAN